MTSVVPSPQPAAADSGNTNPNLVRDGGFQKAPNFLESEYVYYNAVARAQNVYLSEWDYGSNGNNLGNDQGPRGNYIDVRSHDYAFDQNEWRDASHGSNAVDLIGMGNQWHGYVGQRIAGLIHGARYEVTFLAGAAFAQDGPHPVRMRYTVTDGSSPFGGVELDRDILEIRKADEATVGSAWKRYWEQHKGSFTAVSSDAYIKFADDTQLGFWSGAQLADVAVRLHSAPVVPFSVSPGDPVSLKRGVETRYPGVQLQNGGQAAVPPQNIKVTLPPGKGLEFASYKLTVMDAFQNTRQYNGNVSADGLTFPDVNLALPQGGSTSVMWVEVKAGAGAPLGSTYLSFSIGDKTSPSSMLNVVE
ncbi:hypothetical protein [Streptomyces alanosinicus]|uniref:Uncharacterized protein n=1 Tax=Streptomyces alanosinicus TaxID=68171 RepID=A0A918YIH8_9ACTN|nr:hypothetical protein [Streptomyces alanosinicus]GHE05104.1 hypothetical protein GCM10010339_39510 [Streptomyces alanosinicus]